RDRLAEADDIAGATHRQELAVAPQIAWPPRQRLLAQGLFDAVEIVADDERLALAREIVQFVGRVADAGRRTFEMRDECGAFVGQIFVVAHTPPPIPPLIPRGPRNARAAACLFLRSFGRPLRLPCAGAEYD